MSDEVELLPCVWCEGQTKRFQMKTTDGTIVEMVEHQGWPHCCVRRDSMTLAQWNTRAIEATRPTDEVVELLLEFVADQFDDGTRSDEYWDWLNNEIATRLGVGPDASERRRNIIECENCGKTHDRRQSCARAAIAAQQVDHD